MEVKGELKEAQVEVRETTAEILSLPTMTARQMYSLEDLHIWVSNGSVWKKQLQKEDQFLDFPLGCVQPSFLTELQFQIEMATLKGVVNPSGNPDTSWILCDGRSINPSDYFTLTAKTNAPDMRGTVPRMKDHARGLNPDGDLALGLYQGDLTASHNHGERTGSSVNDSPSAESWTRSATGGVGGSSPTRAAVFGGNTDSALDIYQRIYTDLSGGNETRAKSTTINYFIKINRTVL